MKTKIVLAVAALALAASIVPSHAFTTIASCSGSSSINGCSTTFVALGNFDTVHVRLVPDFFFVGSATVQIFEVGNKFNQANYESTWATGRVQLEGPKYSGPYQLLAGHTYALLVSTKTSQNRLPVSNGDVTGLVEV